MMQMLLGSSSQPRPSSWHSISTFFLCFWLLLVASSGRSSTALHRRRTSRPDRQLQTETRLWDISEPSTDYNGMRLELEHTVRDQVRESNVRIDLFRDESCTILLDNPNSQFIAVDVVNDLSPFGDGSGTRKVTVNYSINPQTISNSLILTTTPEYPIVSFCTRFNLIDPATNQVANSLDTPVAVRVDVLERFEILGILEDEKDNFGAEVFECDSENLRIEEPSVKTQGAQLRLCIQPDSFTQDFGVVMLRVNQLRLVRGDVSLDVIVPNGVIQDLDRTQYRCIAGNPVCSVTAEIPNSFFYSEGTVRVEGVAWMQYATRSSGNRRLDQVSFESRRSQEQLQEMEAFPSAVWKHQRHLQASEGGLFIGGKEFSMTFQVNPAGTDWQAEAFLCDGRNRRFQGDAETRPRHVDDMIRVCFMPTEEARERGVYIRQLSFFNFEQEDNNNQFAVRATATQADDSLFICNSGEPLCALKIELRDDFFEKNLDVIGNGEVLLQYGTEPFFQSSTASVRNLQSNSDPTVDAGFAGRSTVSIRFRTDPTYIPPSKRTWKEKADDWWRSNPLFLRIAYILAVVIGFLILLCFLWAIFCGNPWAKSRKRLQEPRQRRKIFIQPTFMRNNGKEKEEEDGNHDDEESGLQQPKEASRKTSEKKEKDITPPPSPVRSKYRLKDGLADESVSSSRTETPVRQSYLKLEPDCAKSPISPRKKGSILALEPDYSKSPKSPRKKSSLIESDMKAESSHSKSPKRLTSKSPRPGRKRSIVTEGAQGTMSPKFPKSGRTKIGEDSTHSTARDNPKSPKTRQAMIGSGSVHSVGSLKSSKTGRSKLGDGSTHTSKSDVSAAQSPKARRSKLGEDGETLQSPTLRASKKTDQGVESTPKSIKSRKKSVDSSKRKTSKSPKPKRTNTAGESKSPKPRRPKVDGDAPLSSGSRRSTRRNNNLEMSASVHSTASTRRTTRPSNNSELSASLHSTTSLKRRGAGGTTSRRGTRLEANEVLSPSGRKISMSARPSDKKPKTSHREATESKNIPDSVPF